MICDYSLSLNFQYNNLIEFIVIWMNPVSYSMNWQTLEPIHQIAISYPSPSFFFTPLYFVNGSLYI